MQIAGKNCLKCGELILMAGDGTWCAECGAPHHDACAEDATCTACNRPFVRGQARQVHSNHCPVCGLRQPGPRENCQKCGTVTVFDNEAAYVAHKSEIRSFGRWQLAISIVEMIAASVLVSLTMGVVGVVIGGVLVGDAVKRLSQVRRTIQFD